jgi:hypothetical protein
MFNLDLTEGVLTAWFIKVKISDLIVYAGALLGFYKNYRANMTIAEQQFKQLGLKNEELEMAWQKARHDYIYHNAPSIFAKIEALSKKTEMTSDDKLALYMSSFAGGMKASLEDEPTEAEKEIMKDKAAQFAVEAKKALVPVVPVTPVVVPVESAVIESTPDPAPEQIKKTNVSKRPTTIFRKPKKAGKK